MSIVVVKKNYKEYKCVEHNKRKYSCKLCKGNAYCKHGTLKANCKEEGCDGSAICECGIIKYFCRKCNGSAFCRHGTHKTRCKMGCGGSAICIHGGRKEYCKLCCGSQICEHDNRREYCKLCDGSQICEHKERRENCILCNGSQICEHNERKNRCILCDGNELCKSLLCKTRASNKYGGFCFCCFAIEFPDDIAVYNYRNKEFAVDTFILQQFKEVNWVCDKSIKGGSSRKRPDLLLDLENKIIIIEIDEFQHSSSRYSYKNDMKRMEELSQDVNNKPIIFIRFNPDSYIDIDGEKIDSCWGSVELRGIIQVVNKLEWDNRLEILKNVVNYWINTEPDNIIETEYLFYNMN